MLYFATSRAKNRFWAALFAGGALLGHHVFMDSHAQTDPSGLSSSTEQFARFASNDPASSIVINHEPLSVFIDTFTVVEAGRRTVNYSAARGRGADYLAAYTQFLGTLKPSTLRSDEQLAYWLNLRNALVLHAFSDKSGGSLKKFRGAFDAPGEGWSKKRITVEGIELSIDDIERGVILSNWRNPLVLYGLYQASSSGPQLHERALSGASVWSDLNSVAVKFTNGGGSVRVRGETLQLASIYAWCRPYLFGGEDANVKTHLAGLAAERLKSRIESTSAVEYTPFSYRLERHEPRSLGREIEEARSGGGGFPSGS